MNQTFKIRCPLPHCTGWVTQLDPEDGSLFMCDDCGQVWETKAELDAAIAAIIERFPYRAAVYRQTAEGFAAVPEAEEPADYEKQVNQEPWA